MKKLSLLFFLISLLALSIMPSMAQSTAQVRVGHFLLGGGDVDLYINGELSAVTRLGYGRVSDWYTIAAGTYSVAIAPARTSIDDAVLGPVDVTFEDGRWITLAATGLAERDRFDFNVLVENYSPLTFNETRLNIFNAIPDGNPIDVTYNDQLLFGLVGYPGSLGSNDGFDDVKLTIGSYTIKIQDNVTKTTLLDLGATNLNDRNNYFLAVFGVAASPSYRLVSTNMVDVSKIPVGDIRERPNADATDGYLRFAHFASGGGDVDIYVNGELSVSGVGYSNVSDFEMLAVGDYTISLAPAGTSSGSALLEYELRVFGGEYITVAFIRASNNRDILATLIFEDFTPTDPDKTRITFFNAVPDPTSLVTLARNDGLLVVQDLAYPQQGSDGYAIRNLDVGRYSFKITDFAIPKVLSEIPEYNYATGTNYLIAHIPSTEGATAWVLVEAEIPSR